MDQDKFQVSGSRALLYIFYESKTDPLKSLLDIQRHMTKSVPDAPKLCVLQENKSTCMFCSLLSTFYFIGDKISAGLFKDENTPSLKENDGHKFVQDVAFNSLI